MEPLRRPRAGTTLPKPTLISASPLRVIPQGAPRGRDAEPRARPEPVCERPAGAPRAPQERRPPGLQPPTRAPRPAAVPTGSHRNARSSASIARRRRRTPNGRTCCSHVTTVPAARCDEAQQAVCTATSRESQSTPGSPFSQQSDRQQRPREPPMPPSHGLGALGPHPPRPDPRDPTDSIRYVAPPPSCR